MKQSDDGIGNTFGSFEAVAFQSRVVWIGWSKALIGSAIRLMRFRWLKEHSTIRP